MSAAENECWANTLASIHSKCLRGRKAVDQTARSPQSSIAGALLYIVFLRELLEGRRLRLGESVTLVAQPSMLHTSSPLCYSAQSVADLIEIAFAPHRQGKHLVGKIRHQLDQIP